MKNFESCPTCSAPTEPALNIYGQPSTSWRECTRCNTLINTYIPMPHQLALHHDPHRYILNAGGYGTGKTMTSRQEVYRHALLTPNGNTLIGAKTTPQYEQTIKRELEADLPRILVKNVSQQKSYMDLVNGHRILYRPFDDPDKLRSYNLSMFVIIEASETPAEAFHQLKTRLRNDAAMFDEHDWRRGIIETNPSAGWVRTDALLNASHIEQHGTTTETYQPSLTPDPYLSAHISATDVNVYLPPTFIDELKINKPLWWVNKFIHGSFMYAEGLVYPSAQRSIVDYFEPPHHWPRLLAADYGLSDKFAFVVAAVDPSKGHVYIYRNKATTDKSIEDLSKMYFDITKDIPSGGFYTQPLLDPKSGAKRDYDKKTLYDHFLDYGIFFQPGHVNLDARIYRTNTYLESGRLFIMDNCEELIEEIQNYKFPERTLETSKRSTDKPIDKNNHSINPLEWICMALPSDPRKLVQGSYDPMGRRLLITDEELEIANRSWQLADEPTTDLFTMPEVQNQWSPF
jgi:phage terminase large subunit